MPPHVYLSTSPNKNIHKRELQREIILQTFHFDNLIELSIDLIYEAFDIGCKICIYLLCSNFEIFIASNPYTVF